jgi:tetratricopeptide (TPR) repeat protein
MVRRATEALATLARAPVPSLLTSLDARGALAYGYYLTGQNAKADGAFAQLTRELDRNGRGDTLAAADAWNNWGLVHHRGDIRKAETLYRRALEIHRSIEGEEGIEPVALHNYAGVLHELGRYGEAEPIFRDAVRRAHERQNTFVEIAGTLELAGMLAENGRLPEARAAVATLDPYVGTDAFTPLRRAYLEYTRGILATAAGDEAVARVAFSESVRLYSGISAKFSGNVLALLGLARTELALGRPSEGESAARRGLSIAESLVERGAPSYLVGRSLAELGRIELAVGHEEAGKKTMRVAIEHLQETLGPDHESTLAARRAVDPGSAPPGG